MTEEIKNSEPTKEKNTVALIWMICSIIWLICLITIIWIRFWIILLTIWFILWIIGLLYKPRTKARIAVIIPAIVWIIATIGLIYVKNSIKVPATEFGTRFESLAENETYWNLLEDKAFRDSVSNEFKRIITTKTKDEFNELYNETSWSDTIEKWSYVFFWLIKESIENTLEKYWLEPEALDVDEENVDEEEINDEEVDEETNEDEEDINEEVTKEENVDEETDEEDNNKNEDKETKNESVEVFNNWEKNDIEEIIDILE